VPFTSNLDLVLWLALVPAFAQAQDDPITRLPAGDPSLQPSISLAHIASRACMASASAVAGVV
jgi:hypothetical protein